MADTLFEDAIVPPADSGIMLAPGENVPNVGFGSDTSMVPNPAGVTTPAQGIGMAPSAAPSAQANTDLRTKLQNLPALGKALVALGAGADAARGVKPQLFSALEADRKDRLEKAVELKAHMEALTDFSKVAKTLTGDAKTNFVDDGVKQLNGMRPGLGDTFKHVAEQPGLLEDLAGYMPYLPEPMRLLIQRDPDKALTTMATAEGLKTVQNARDQYLLKLGSQKGAATVGNAQQLEQFGVPKELIDGFLKSPTASNFNKLNQALPEKHPFRMSPDEMQAAATHGETFYPAMGVMSPKGEGEVLKKKAEDQIANPEGHAPKTRTIQRGSQNVNQEFKGGEWVDVGSGPKFNPAYKPPSGYEVDPDNPGELRPVKGGPKDTGANPQRDKLQADGLAMYRAEYPNGKLRSTDPTAEQYVADYIKKKGAGAAPAGAPQTPEEYRTKFGKPPPTIGNKAGFDKLKPGEGFIDGRTGKYTIKG
jgi:hypothetical protein